ncbi:MAG: M20 family metallopeptidase [Puniceicoccaceae bacterium]
MKYQSLNESIDAVLPDIIALRRDLHQHPELAYEEYRTAGKVVEAISGIEGLDIKTGLAGSGVAVTLGKQLEGPCVALRADMDALPIEEASGVEWTSRTQGKMHACGHDGHTAMLVGAIQVLAGLRDELKGPVKFIFQPAEEGGAGAAKMCREGVLEDPKVDAIFGLHNNLPDPHLKSGRIAYNSGALMAGTGTFDIEVIGVGGHAAFPENCVDPLYIGACIVDQLQGIVSRGMDPRTPAVVSVTRFHAGTAYNIIAGQSYLHGTFRALDMGILEDLRDRIIQVANRVAEAHGAKVKIRCDVGYPVLINHPEAEKVFMAIVEETGEQERLLEVNPILGGEDFAFFGEQVPSFFYFLPACPEDVETVPACHHPAFDFNDDLIPLGIRLHVEMARRFARLWKP